MTSDITLSVDPTGSWAGVNTFVPLACFDWRTIWVDHTLWSTCNIRISKILWNTLTSSCPTSRLTICICATRRWVARINYFCCSGRRGGFYITYSEWISHKTWVTYTARLVSINFAVSVWPTNSWTRIYAFISNTGKIIRTIRIQCAFWFAFDIRISRQTRWTSAGSCRISFSAFGINSTWSGITRINELRLSWCC